MEAASQSGVVVSSSMQIADLPSEAADIQEEENEARKGKKSGRGAPGACLCGFSGWLEPACLYAVCSGSTLMYMHAPLFVSACAVLFLKGGCEVFIKSGSIIAWSGISCCNCCREYEKGGSG